MKSVKYALIFLFKKIINVIYPKQCVICGKYDEYILCDKCYNVYKGNMIIDKYKDKYFNEHLYIFKYEGKIRKIILDYKFNDKSYYCDFFVKIIIKNEKICRKIENYDIMIPVPIHSKRKRERGYDQCELITRKLVNHLDKIQLITDVLIKYKNTKRQSLLNYDERIQNVKQVYKIENKEKILGKKIILFDDIYTTGSTANECARVLMENGAKEIMIFTIAKD